VQAISSYVRGVLSSHAVFKGVGVGSQVRNSSSAGPAVVQRYSDNFVCAAGRLNTANQSLQRLPQLLHSKLHALDVGMMLK
jgi:hypothetical protein